MPTRTVDSYLCRDHKVAVMEPIWRALCRRGADAQCVLEAPDTHRAMGATTTPGRCKALALALNNLGAPEQAAAVAHHGERLVLQ